MFHDWYLTSQTGDYLPKFMPRPNNWGYSFTADGKLGRGLLLHNNTYQEPSPEIKDLAMGYPRGSTSATGITTSIRHKILGACLDFNISNWLIGASLKLHTVNSFSMLPGAFMPSSRDSKLLPGSRTLFNSLLPRAVYGFT